MDNKMLGIVANRIIRNLKIPNTLLRKYKAKTLVPTKLIAVQLNGKNNHTRERHLALINRIIQRLLSYENINFNSIKSLQK